MIGFVFTVFLKISGVSPIWRVFFVKKYVFFGLEPRISGCFWLKAGVFFDFFGKFLLDSPSARLSYDPGLFIRGFRSCFSRGFAGSTDFVFFGKVCNLQNLLKLFVSGML